MPEFLPGLPGVYVAGNAGDGGVVSSNRGVVLGPSAGNAHWYQASEAVCQFYAPGISPRLVAVDVLTGNQRDLFLDGANKIVAGYGHWWAQTQHSGFLLDGQPTTKRVRAFGSDGTIAWFPINGTGIILSRSNQPDVTINTTLGPEEPIQLIEGGCVWVEGTVKSWGIPDFPPDPVFVRIGDPPWIGWLKAVRVGGVWWLAYQSYGRASVVFHPVTEVRGYAWPAPLAYRLDAVMLDRPKLIWSSNDADDPAHIVVIDVDLSAERVLLSGISNPPPPNPPEPPEPPKPMQGITDAQFTTLETVRAKYGETLTEAEIGALLNEVAWIHRAEGVGLQRKDSGTNCPQPRTGIPVWRGMRFAGNVGQDVLGAASIGKCIPTRGEVGPADPATFVAPVEPLDSPPEPPKPPAPDLSAILKSIEDLRANTQSALSLLGEMLADARVRLTALEQKPTPVPQLPKLRVSGRTGTSLYHSHPFTADVEEVK